MDPAENMSKRILILGSSHVRRLRDYMLREPSTSFSFDLSPRDLVVKLHGVGGMTTRSVYKQLHAVSSFRSDVVILHVGGNDLSVDKPEDVHRRLVRLTRRLKQDYGVRVVLVSSVLHRYHLEGYNDMVDELNHRLKQTLDNEPLAKFWINRRFYKNRKLMHRDQVHLNDQGHYRLYMSFKSAIVHGLHLADN